MTISRLLAGLGVVVLGIAVAVPTPQPQNPLDERVLSLVKDLNASDNRNRWWEQRGAEVTREVADRAAAMGAEAIERRAGNAAEAFYGFAGIAFLRLGDRQKALNSMLSMNEVGFMRAETPEQYKAVRSAVIGLGQRAAQEKLADLEFRFAVLAADCSWFAGQPEGDRSPDEAWLETMLADLVSAFQKATANTSAVWLERLASLATPAIEHSTSRFFAKQTDIDAHLKSLAGLVDTAFPPDFSYRSVIGDENKTSATAAVLADLSYRYGNAALASARLAVVSEAERSKGNLERYLNLIHKRYRGERAANRPQNQLQQLRKDARAVAMQIRAGYRSRAGRILNAYAMDTAYGEMLRDELRVQDAEPREDLFAAVEALKARTILDRLSNPPSPAPNAGFEARATELEKRILGFAPDDTSKDDLYMSEAKLSSLVSGFDTVDSAVAARRGALRELEGLYANAKAGYSGVAEPATLAAVQRALQPDEAMIEYVIPYYELHPASDLGILLITRDSVEVAHINMEQILPSKGLTGSISIDGKARVDFSPLGEAVIQTRVAIRKSDEKLARHQLGEFYKLLIQPLAAKGFRPEKYARVIVVPHGILHYLPFAALMDAKGEPLIKKTAITMAPSASVWLKLCERAGPAQGWVGFANPKLSGDFAPLDNSQREVERISTLLTGMPVRLLTGAGANRREFGSAAAAGGILHIATHGEFPDENALDQHALLLAADAAADQPLRARDIRQMKLPATRLAVLSICNGGLFRMGPTDEPYGLVPAFFDAGAQNVMATLWPADDAFARTFMVEFYRHLLNDGPAVAFQKASLRFVGEDELIRRWAGFVLSGPGRPFAKTP